MTLSDVQIERYSRQILLEEVGGTGQERLLGAKVLIIGIGGLGSPAALYLAAAGVGTLGLMDADSVDLSNLQRQVMHHTPDVGRDKVVCAAEKIHAMNPDVSVNTYTQWAVADTIRQVIRQYDFVIDGTDNFAAKFLINDACYFERKPLSHGGILRFDGQLMTILPGRSACYRCVFDAPPPADAVPSCAQAGVLGVLAGVIGTLQATEAIKTILGIGDLLTDCLLTYNALTMQVRKVSVNRNLRCRLCGDTPTLTSLVDHDQTVCDLKGAQS
ncbi:MAG: molybdopterin-synthase adenylyltransferase MoeB [Phycisphaerae bacterium]|nr:molybdopterin-synthase adenylyltransferase MoeB [Phycisphaerae bacterium]